MTSGKFKSIPIDSITVDRETRQRKSLNGIEDLADSIRRVGLINPPVIRKDGTLIAGERRLTACRHLGWTSIPIQYIEDLPEHEARLVELEENIRRIDLDWKDQCLAIQEYYNLRAEHDTEWTVTKTSQAIGLSNQAISGYLSVAREIVGNNERVANAPKFSVARGIVARQTNRKRADPLGETATVLFDDEPEEEEAAPSIPLLNEDFLKWTPEVKFNFIHCDFPYGINADKHAQGNAAARGGYEDSRDVYFTLLQSLCDRTDELCTPNAHIMFWFSMEYYNETIDLLEGVGWKILRHPLIWFKSDNSGILPDHRRQPRRVYETALMGARGDRHLVGPVANCFPHPNVKSAHMSEKPRAMLQHFFRMFVDDSTVMLDPTCGSGNAVRVAQDAGAKLALGLERDKDFYAMALEGWDDD